MKKIVEDKKENISIKINDEVKKTIKVAQEEAPKVIVKDEKQEVKSKVLKDDLHVKADSEIKAPETTRVNEPKVESNIPKKGLIENILQGIKTDKQSTCLKNG